MRPRSAVYRVGESRPSSLFYASGIGAIVDLPKLSVIVMGIDEWDTERSREIVEDRLLRIVKSELGPQVDRLYGPPEEELRRPGLARRFGEMPVGVPVGTFPRWLLCPLCRLLAPISSDLFRFKYDRFRADRTAYYHENCPKRKGNTGIPAIPARFVAACKHGHLDDFPWMSYVHGGPTICPGPLRMRETGLSGEASAVLVQCDTCEKRRGMGQVFESEGRKAMPHCRGRRPHLRDYDEDGCDEQLHPILLGASNGWFPLSVSVLSVPATDDLAGFVRARWEQLQNMTDIGFFRTLASMNLITGLDRYPVDDVWREIEKRRGGVDSAEQDRPATIKDPEWQAFAQPTPENSEPDFQLRPVSSPPGYTRQIHRVVLAERLRQVQAFIGFTRLEAPPSNADLEDMDANARAPISRHRPRWVPAAEVRGEGIFLHFDESVLSEWEQSIPLLRRRREFAEAHRAWRNAHGRDRDAEPREIIRYILLHSFSHALMRQLCLECGYGTASLQERIYSRTEDTGDPMAGILLYTAAPDSEGTLGGLVRLGEPERLQRHIDHALDRVHLCASDPLCSEHTISTGEGAATIHGAACHACLFIPETSCEHGNRYLDRALLVPTFTHKDYAFFKPL